MLVPVGQSISLPVQIVCATSAPPLHVEGILVEYDGKTCEVELPAAASISAGTQVIVSLEKGGGLRMITELVEVRGQHLQLRVTRVSRRDKRDYPRQDAGIDLRYQVVRTDRTRRSAPAFINGLSDVSDPEPWFEPHPFMNFSGSGVRFEDEENCAAEDQVLLQLRLPTSERWYHAIGVVVRVEAMEMPSSGRSHHVAIQFTELPPDAVEALTRFTLDCQLRAMEGPIE